MENQNGGDITPENDVNEEVVVEENDDSDALREKLIKVSEQNKQLFSRAKKAEGFELKDGQWVKPELPEETKEKVETKVETDQPKEPSKSDDLDYGQLAFHNTKTDVLKIESAEDIEFLKKTITETGKSQQAILESTWFQSELKERISTRESQNAIPKAKNRSGQQGTTDLDIATAKFNETGELPEDFKTRSEIVKNMVKSEEEKGMFTGPSVIGPTGQSF